MDPHSAEALLEAFNATAAHVWTPSSSLFTAAGLSKQHTAAVCDDELQRLALMLSRVRDALGAAVVQVATLRNRSAPVAQIPDDILYLIFRTCADDAPRNALRSVLAVSQVCAYWRALALSRPMLWTRVDLADTSEPLARLVVARSGTCALRTSWPVALYASPRRDFAVQLCAENLDRMAELSLVAPRTALGPLLQGSAPKLERLFLQDADAFAYAPLVLPRVPFGGATPRLRDVRLVGVRLPWAPGSYRNLRSLSIQRCNVGCDDPQDTDLCHIFRDSPQLEHLHLALRSTLRSDGPGDALLAPRSCTRVAMQRLRTLTLELPVAYAAHVLGAITLPPTLEALALTVEAPHAAPDAVPTLVDPALLPRALFADTVCLEVRDSASSGGVALRGHTSAAPAGAAAARWELGWKHRSRLPRGTLEDVARALHTHYALHGVRTVVLHAEDGNVQDVGDVLPLLAPLAHVRAFRSETWGTRTLCALAAPAMHAWWRGVEAAEVLVSACEPGLPAVLEALGAAAGAAKAMRTLDITFRMSRLAEIDAALVRDMVSRVRRNGVAVSCRRVSPYQVCGTADSGESFEPRTAANTA